MSSHRTVFAASASPVASGVAGRIDGQDGTALSLVHHGLMLIDVILPARLAAIYRIYISAGEYGADLATGASSVTKSIRVTGWPVKILPASLTTKVEGIRKGAHHQQFNYTPKHNIPFAQTFGAVVNSPITVG